MPVRMSDDARNFKLKLNGIINGLKDGLSIVGDIARDEIVRTTLAGIGANDQSFTKYSPAYEEMIAAVGGKTGGVVDLRGIFWHQGRGLKGKSQRFKQLSEKIRNGKTKDDKDKLKQEADRQKRLLRRAAGRRAFVRITIGKKSFFAQTQETRPRRGLEDPESEMSTDRIKVKVTGFELTLIYESRKIDYMIWHNEGTARLPKREWFSIEKTAVKGAIFGALREMFKALVKEFNDV